MNRNKEVWILAGLCDKSQSFKILKLLESVKNLRILEQTNRVLQLQHHFLIYNQDALQ